ncbi:MAG: cyclic nucleotide-binding domain-containing protein [Thermodesulfovibrionales bacterium]|nr:cyclic nucleotide-binding domain-containing protein [Thermodesulfovibrionales bacterium]
MGKNYWEMYFGSVRQEDWAGAKGALEYLTSIERNNPQVHLKLGDIYQRMGKSPHAIASYHQSAWLLQNKGFIQKALALYKIILRLDPENDEALKLSKELMIELESAKAAKSATSGLGAQVIKESFEEKQEVETGMPLGLEEEEEPGAGEEQPGMETPHPLELPVKPEQEIELGPSAPADDFTERTAYTEETNEVTSLPEIQEPEKPATGKKPAAAEISGREEGITFELPSLFSPLPREEAQRLLGDITPQIYPAGQTIIEEGDSGDSIYIIQSGQAKVVTHIIGKEIELAILSPGDVFGEVAFLTGRPRTASVIALYDVEVREIDKFLLQEIIESYPETVRKIHDFYQCRVQDTMQKVKSRIEQ